MTKSVTSLRDTVRTLDEAAELARAAVTDAEIAHTSAIRRAVLENDHKPIAKAEASLAAARRDHDRALAASEAARQLLLEAEQRERDAAEAAAREDAERRIEEMARLAEQADVAFATGAALLTRIREIETATHRAVHGAFGTPPAAAPFTANEAGHAVASYLRSVAIRHPADPAGWTGRAAEKAAGNVRRALKR